jgi:hypothetical protein
VSVGLDRFTRDEREQQQPLGSIADGKEILARSVGCRLDLWRLQQKPRDSGRTPRICIGTFLLTREGRADRLDKHVGRIVRGQPPSLLDLAVSITESNDPGVTDVIPISVVRVLFAIRTRQFLNDLLFVVRLVMVHTIVTVLFVRATLTAVQLTFAHVEVKQDLRNLVGRGRIDDPAIHAVLDLQRNT